MRYLVSTIVFILLFVVPLGSWYYLQTGLNYRKEALKELEAKGEFSAQGFDLNLLKAKTTFLQLKPINEEVLPAVFDQYKKSQTYQLISVQEPTLENDGWKTISADLAKAISDKYNGAGMMLIDTAMQVRNTYNIDKEGISKMIEHTSIVLPRVKEMDIKLRNDE